jgi:hypothetical protein
MTLVTFSTAASGSASTFSAAALGSVIPFSTATSGSVITLSTSVSGSAITCSIAIPCSMVICIGAALTPHQTEQRRSTVKSIKFETIAIEMLNIVNFPSTPSGILNVVAKFAISKFIMKKLLASSSHPQSS